MASRQLSVLRRFPTRSELLVGKESALRHSRRRVVERLADLLTHARHRADGGDSNESGDQAIFDGGRAPIIFKKLKRSIFTSRSPVALISQSVQRSQRRSAPQKYG